LWTWLAVSCQNQESRGQRLRVVHNHGDADWHGSFGGGSIVLGGSSDGGGSSGAAAAAATQAADQLQSPGSARAAETDAAVSAAATKALFSGSSEGLEMRMRQ